MFLTPFSGLSLADGRTDDQPMGGEPGGEVLDVPEGARRLLTVVGVAVTRDANDSFYVIEDFLPLAVTASSGGHRGTLLMGKIGPHGHRKRKPGQL